MFADEDFEDTARREVKEETGIDCEFVSLVALRQTQQHQMNCADIHVICHMRPINTDVTICHVEIEDCKWVDVSIGNDSLCSSVLQDQPQ